MRILSLLPSSTEILFQLGLGDQVVGVTFECDFPPEARSKRIVSTSALPEGLTPAEIDAVVKQRMAAGEDLYRLDRGAFADIDPTLVVTQDLCAVCAVDVTKVDDAVAYLGCTAEILTLDPMTLDEVIDSVRLVGDATGRRPRLPTSSSPNAANGSAAVAAKLAGAAARPTLLLEWTDPAFTDGHWVPDMIAAAGGRSVMGRPGHNSQGATWEEIGGMWMRRRDRRAVRFPSRGRDRIGRARSSPAACCPTMPRSGQSMPTRSSCDRARGWSKVSRSSPRSCIPIVTARPIPAAATECADLRFTLCQRR